MTRATLIAHTILSFAFGFLMVAAFMSAAAGGLV